MQFCVAVRMEILRFSYSLSLSLSLGPHIFCVSEFTVMNNIQNSGIQCILNNKEPWVTVAKKLQNINYTYSHIVTISLSCRYIFGAQRIFQVLFLLLLFFIVVGVVGVVV